jgi:trk system potassium uptake protein TrkA
VIPTGETRIEPNDHLLVIGKSELMQEHLHLLGVTPRPMRKIFIIGGGRVGFNVAYGLEQDSNDYQVKLLDLNAQHCDDHGNRGLFAT